ncbi:hypothetical protein HJC99_03960 [Candidatus Saccharibacteria bacterium]|nr:hypothetical protein [Candidatus Saccharibacteria bacterium]
MKKILIRKIGVGSFAKYIGVAAALLAVVEGVFSGIAGSVAILSSHWNMWDKLGSTLGLWVLAIVIYPMLAFLLGWLYGAVLALVTNLFLHSANGIELDIEDAAIVPASTVA